MVVLWNNCAMARRGAPDGNKNALKHGFYSKQMRPTELADLDALMDVGLSNEINMLRVLLRRILDIAAGEMTPELAISVLNATGTNMTRLANMMKTQKYLNGDGGGNMMSILSQALNEVVKELAEQP